MNNANYELLDINNTINNSLLYYICKVIKSQNQRRKIIKLIKREQDSSIISYVVFECLIKRLIIQIMKSYLKGTKYENDDCYCSIENIREFSGSFLKRNNTITINKFVLENLYKGDILAFLPIFHELNHFKIKYDIKLGKNDENINRIIKENIIGSYVSNYYNANYKYISEEVYADLLSCKDLLKIIERFQLLISKKNLDYIKRTICCCINRYKNYKRNVKSLNIKHDYVDFRELFDIISSGHLDLLNNFQTELEHIKTMSL